MKITALVENTTISERYKPKHGLSVHIKTDNHNILFDLGPNDLFIKNAEKLKVELEDVDTLIISHGHKDHGGGLKEFLKVNKKAKIYIHKDAFDEHYAGVLGLFHFPISLDSDLKNNSRIILVEDTLKIDEELMLFSKIDSNKMLSKSNKSLYAKNDKKYVEDDFKHEQNLIITENNKSYLFAGCAHRGISNIVDQAEIITGESMDYVIGGFHMYNPVSRKSEDKELISKVGTYLAEKNAVFYTCHCTGELAFNQLKEILDNRINYLKTGMVLDL